MHSVTWADMAAQVILCASFLLFLAGPISGEWELASVLNNIWVAQQWCVSGYNNTLNQWIFTVELEPKENKFDNLCCKVLDKIIKRQ